MIITRIWRRQPGTWFCISTKKGRGTWLDSWFHKEKLHTVAAFVERHRDCDVYFCPHGFSAKRRIKENAVAPHLLWSDMDEAHPDKVKWRPSFAFESSPGRYVGLWVMDGVVTEELNRRLVYAIGADKSGWDFGQVLRVPGTINYKYASLPRTRIMWSDGPSYNVEELKTQLPREEKAESYDASDAAEVYRKFERKMKASVRRECTNKKEPPEGSRSEMFMKLAHEFVEVGMSRGEAVTLLKANRWNKYRGRRDEDALITKTVDKAINKGVRGSRVDVDERDDGPDYEWFGQSLADVEEQNIDWLWYPYLARGQVTILEGPPGLGKSYLAQMIAGHIIDGKSLPSTRERRIAPSRVLYCDLENSVASVTKKRITWNGFKRQGNYFQEERPFSVDDIEVMEQIEERLGKLKPAIVVFDTMNTYLGRADAFKAHEITQTMTRFRQLAEQYQCAVVLVRHLTKGSRDRDLIERGQGSMSIAGMARLIIQVGRMPDDEDVKVFGMVKNNLTKFPMPMTFTIDEKASKEDPDSSKFTWGEWQKGRTFEEIMATKKEEGGSALDDAKDFVRDQLSGKTEVSNAALHEAAERASIRAATLKRALEVLGAKKSGSRWSMT